MLANWPKFLADALSVIVSDLSTTPSQFVVDIRDQARVAQARMEFEMLIGVHYTERRPVLLLFNSSEGVKDWRMEGLFEVGERRKERPEIKMMYADIFKSGDGCQEVYNWVLEVSGMKSKTKCAPCFCLI